MKILILVNQNDGFEKEYIYKQPLLDRNAEFKFREADTLGIFTTQQWLEEQTLPHLFVTD